MKGMHKIIMKKLSCFNFTVRVILIIILSKNVIAQSGWAVQNPLPTESFLLTVEPVTDSKIFLGGLGGTLLKTTDSGNTWTVQKFQNLVNIKRIRFTDYSNGWLLESEHLFHTNDGGVNWTELIIDTDMSTYYFMDIICFDNALYLFLKPQTAAIWELPAAKSLIYKSIDDGQTWAQSEQEINGKMNGAFFINENLGFILVEETVSISESYTYFYKTNNGGTTWNKRNFTGGYVGVEPGIFFQSEEVGFIGKYRTTDSGLTWENKFDSLDSLSELVKDICFADSLNGWAISGTKIFQTTDSGITWSDKNQYSSHQLTDINFSGDGTGWMIGWAGNIFKKKADANFWVQLSEGVRHALNDVFFIDKNEGWCVGTSGCILHTSNGGETWEEQSSGTDSTLYKIKFVDKLEGWIAGYYTVLHTTDGGKSWKVRNDLHWWFADIDFFDEENGLLIERFGAVLKTSDGGVSWQSVTSQPLSGRLTSVSINNENEAWIGGWQGFGHTTDRGATIQWHDVPNISLVRDIQFIDDNTGFLCNDYGDFLKTVDGGWTWHELPRGEGINDVMETFFTLDIDTAWIYLGIAGGYLEQITSNQSLEKTGAPEYWVNSINSIFFTDSNNGWAVGVGGTILKYTDEGISSITENSPIIEKHVSIYPNPLSRNGAKIIFSLNRQQHVTIRIYNAIGQKVYELFNGIANTGQNSFSWKPNGIAAGTYFISINCGEFSRVQKCILFQ